MRRAIFVAMLMVLMAFGTASAAYPPEYLNDGDLILSGHLNGTAWYIDRNSVFVEQEEPPTYIITYQTFAARYDVNSGEVTRVFEATPHKSKYDVDRGMIFSFNFNRDYSQWAHVKPDEQGGPIAYSEELAWYIAYGTKFYGNAYPSYFKDEIYRRVDNA